MQRSPITLSLAATIVLAVTAPQGAHASGFALREQSATGQGTSFAGSTASAQDASTIFFNPAGMTELAGNQAVGVLSYIRPVSDLGNAAATRAAVLGGSAISGNRAPGDIANDALVPAVYGVWAATPDLRLGLGINSPWGLVTDYPDNWVGRYHALKSDLKTVNINPSVAYRVNPWLSLGAGVQVEHAKAELSQAVDFGASLARLGLGLPGSADGRGEVTGSDWGFGYTAGVMVEPRPDTRIGLSFRSKVSHELEGDAEFTGVPAALAAAVRNTGARAGVDMPEIVSAGIHHELTPQWAVMADVSWTNWSRFKELRIKFDNGRADSVTEENWKDSWFYALGIAYKPTEQWTVRAGIAYDQSPVPDAFRTPRIPDEDRTWLSLGAEYKLNDALTASVAYSHIFVDDSTLSLRDPGTGPNAGRGNLSGTYENQIDIIAAQLKYKF